VPIDEPADRDPWDDENLIETARDNFGVGADAGLPDEVRFRASVTRVIRKRLENVTEHSRMTPAIFFLLPTGPKLPDKESLELVPMLDNGVTQVEGNLWFVGPQAGSGYRYTLEEWIDDAAIFATAIDSLDVGHVPAIVFEPRPTSVEARFYPNGLREHDCYEKMRLNARTITIEDAVEVVERVYRQSLVTPDAQLACGKLWVKPARHWPVMDAEERIQLQLRTGLIGAFPNCVVRSEQPQTSGRLDLEIEGPVSGGGYVRHLVLELKVLRSFRSSGKPVAEAEMLAWVKEGVDQAASYGDERKATARALFCFDMRKTFSGDACFSQVRSRAKRLKVALRVWHLFATSKSYREWQTAGPEVA
jgi:hypothetical protein